MAPLDEKAQLLLQQELGHDERHVEAADVPHKTHFAAKRQQETADEYSYVVLQLNATKRVIECSDGLQWIIQRRKRGGAERPWRAVHYCRTREVLQRLCATSCGPLGAEELNLLAALPERIGNVVAGQPQMANLRGRDGQNVTQQVVIGLPHLGEVG